MDLKQAVTSFGPQEGRRVFREGPKFFELCPIFFNYVQQIFPGGAKNFLGLLGPPCAPLITGLISRGIYWHSVRQFIEECPQERKPWSILGKNQEWKGIVGTHAVKALSSFVTTRLCECGFSVLAQIKAKTRNCIKPEDDMRLALSKIVPNFDKAVETTQTHGSHWLHSK